MRKLYTVIILLFAIVLSGCDKREGAFFPNESAIEIDPDSKTFIMFGDISSFAGNISDAGSAIASRNYWVGQTIVYYTYDNKGGALYRLQKSNSASSGYESELIKQYTDGTSGFAKMRTVIEDAKAKAEANHYGLSIGSHGTGWVPFSLKGSIERRVADTEAAHEIFNKPYGTQTRFLASDYNYRTMEVPELAAALAGLDLDFVLLDQCFMGGVEVVYELRDVAPYLIVSPAEVMYAGFPYGKVIPQLFDDWENLRAVCDVFVEHYASSSAPYATVSLIDTSKLEGVAESMRAIAFAQSAIGNILPTQSALSMFQVFEGMNKHLFYDFGQYVGDAALPVNSALLTDFETALSQAVIHKNRTAKINSAFPSGSGTIISIDHFSGLTSYIPDSGVVDGQFLTKYKDTSWYDAVYGI